MVPRILVADALSPRAADVLAASGLEVVSRKDLGTTPVIDVIDGFDGLLVRSATKVDAAMFARASRLKIVGRAGIGVDNVDVAAATANGVVVMNTPLGNATTTAEHAISMMMALTRMIPQATASMKAGRWEKNTFNGREVTGKRIGILGLGNIGKIVADRARGLHMEVLAYDPFLSVSAANELDVQKVDLDQLFAEADYVTIHTPLTEETRHLVGARLLSRMKKGSFLIHCARGGIVDERALLEALDAGTLAGAALDVIEVEPPPADHPLVAHPNVILTPHLGASTVEAQEAVALQIAEQVVAYFRDGTVKNAVNGWSISGSAMVVLQPWVELGARVGALAAQAHTGEVEAVTVRYFGAGASVDRAPVTAHALAAILNHKVHLSAKPLAAASVAAGRGIRVEVVAASDHPDFTNALSVEVVGGGRRTEVIGVVFGRAEPRVVSVDGYRLDLVPTGHVLLIKNEDRPGVIGRIGTALGGNGINVSRLAVGLKREAGHALALWSTDARVPDALLREVAGSPDVIAALRIELPY